MTLILGMSKDEGIYLSVDYRVTDGRTGKLQDDGAIKFLGVSYPPFGSGPTALLAYTGLAILPDGTATGAWLRETLRGDVDESFNQSMIHLRTRLDRDILPHKYPLIINALVIQANRRFLGGLSNVRKDYSLADSFGYGMDEQTEPVAFATGSGAERVSIDGHLEKLQDQLRVRPRSPIDHMRLLAAVNRRVATKEGTVSPHCHVTFVDAPDSGYDRTSPRSMSFVEKGEEVPFEFSWIRLGIDLSGVVRRFHEQATEVLGWNPEALVAAVVAFVLGFATALLFTWRFPSSAWNKTGASTAVPIAAIVGVGLILTSLNMPTLEVGVLGGLAGVILGYAVSPFWRP